MTPNKRDLKAYARFDGTGRIVPGSLVLRRSKPKVGKWKEVDTYECCNVLQTPVLVTIEGTFPYTAASIEIGPEDGSWYQPLTSFTSAGASDINELAALYGSQLSNLGTFKVVNGDLYWTPSTQIAEFYKGNSTTALYASSFED
jgi:hypothetical protein